MRESFIVVPGWASCSCSFQCNACMPRMHACTKVILSFQYIYRPTISGSRDSGYTNKPAYVNNVLKVEK